jgi:murein DD-endopeptidase MepM/ murein hydrolase activator NlpD
VAIGTALLVGVAVAAPAGADPYDERARVNRDLARTQAALETASAQVSAAATAYQQANAKLPAARQRLAEARGVVAGALAAAASARRTAEAAAAVVSREVAGFAAAERTVAQARAEVGRFAARAYMGQSFANANALMRVADPADLVTVLGYTRFVAAQQRHAVQAATSARVVAKERENTAVRARQAAEAAAAAARRALARATRAEQAAESAAFQVQALITERQQALRIAEAGRAETMARYAELKAESARIAAEIRALAKRKGVRAPIGSVGARLPMPVHGWKSSDFGMRYDPYYGVWQLHAGTDFAAAGGSPIYAVADGRVFRAGWNGGYGRYTCIYHGLYKGRGLGTCYAHQSSILVNSGDHVARGDLIGRVGTTGASTGNHLHFEVRLDGDPVDPVPWLPGCLC